MKSLVEKTKSSKKIYDGTMLHVYEDKVICPNDVESVREYVKHSFACAILPITDDGNVILEKQYRYPLEKVLIEIPAGKGDEGETPLSCAKRELKEETGYTGKLLKLGEFIPACAYSTEIIYLYLATNLKKGKNHLDKDENLYVFKKPINEFLSMCDSGKITDGKTLAAAYLYIRKHMN